ncbi:hypothetical protein [Romboutsia lituseburensis]|uniref:hypothetical protein n=1 Tax=Romboutsia lituseburensis TaxID=1537 RepID=UPI00215AAB2C|nr:hypothetical protein [Romboutsia lituseburensis]MCR8747120.1 hypothetical protein [Romboutsia lituseburensis]
MTIKNKYTINDISKCLCDEFKGQEITREEYLNLSENLSTIQLTDNSRIYKICDSNFIQSLLSEKEKTEIQITIDHFNKICNDIEFSSYQYQISTGNLIIVILESTDKGMLSSFTMDGIGDFLFNCLSKFIDDDIEKSENPLDEIIEELKHFKPYGKYFK